MSDLATLMSECKYSSTIELTVSRVSLWCEENLQDFFYVEFKDDGTKTYLFKSAEDKLLFDLRWTNEEKNTQVNYIQIVV